MLCWPGLVKGEMKFAKTQNYNLNKPEVTDPLRVDDFNANADMIDAALGALSTAVGNAGNCKIAIGTYAGNDAYGADNPTRLDVGFAPELVFIGFEEKNCRLFLPIWGKHFDFDNAFSSASYTATWGDTFFLYTARMLTDK